VLVQLVPELGGASGPRLVMRVGGGEVGGGLVEVAALERARALGAKRVFLLSNTKAYQAINLYFKLGFRCEALDSTEFKRANIQMAINV